MIESFHVTDDDKRIAFFAGLVTSAFALAEAMSSSIWGRFSDRFGRKPILLSGLAGTGISMLLFGFSFRLEVALLARFLGGLLNGNIGVLQTTVAEVVTNENHQGVAFALMPTIWCIGAVLGSWVGGILADPVHSYPDLFPPGGLFEKFPYLLPNLVCAGIVVMSILVGLLFLEETHEDLQDKRDTGLQIGHWIEDKIRKRSSGEGFGSTTGGLGETLVLLAEGEQPPDYRSTAPSPDMQPTPLASPPPYHSIEVSDVEFRLNEQSLEAASNDNEIARQEASVWQNLNFQLVLNITGYGILAYHTISAEQLIPILFSLPESAGESHLPFWFTGGFALQTKTIGSILAVQGAIQVVATLVVFPYVQKKLGTLATFRMVVLAYPLLYILVPYLTLVPVTLRMPAIYAILVFKVTAQAFAFPSNNIMLANATPKRALGTFNGFAQSSASLARAIGPSLSGLLQAAGLARGMLGLPWWFNASIALIGAILSLFMVDRKPKPKTSEKLGPGATAESASPVTVTEVNAALVAADSASAPEESVMARPTSPLLVRLSLDIRREAREPRRSSKRASRG